MNNFKKAAWINETNIYEVNLRQYTPEGTFHAFLKELPRLKKMGIETLWFMPLTPISLKNRKGTMGSYYACSDYTSINPEFGSTSDFKNLVNTCHSMGFKIMIDWVANHTGWDHKWVNDHPGYYLMDPETGTFKMASGMDDIIELDYGNPSMRKAMIDAMKWWVTEFDIDGFRSDLAFWVTLDFWKEARTELEKTKILFWLAEADVLEHATYLEAFDAAYTWSWMHKTADFYKNGEDISVLTDLLDRYNDVCSDQGISLWFTSNHDENSWNGTEYEKYGSMLPVMNVLSFTWSGIPMIYSGQELPNMKRLEFFEKDVIDWNGNNRLEDFYHQLLYLRKKNPALRASNRSCDTIPLHHNDSRKIVCFLRRNEMNEVLVILNFSPERIGFELNNEELCGDYNEIFTGEKQNFSFNDRFIEMDPWSYRVYEK